MLISKMNMHTKYEKCTLYGSSVVGNDKVCEPTCNAVFPSSDLTTMGTAIARTLAASLSSWVFFMALIIVGASTSLFSPVNSCMYFVTLIF